MPGNRQHKKSEFQRHIAARVHGVRCYLRSGSHAVQDIHEELAASLEAPLARHQREAFRRLHERYRTRRQESRDELVTDIFEDLDILLFDGLLRSQTKVKFGHAGKDTSAYAELPAFSLPWPAPFRIILDKKKAWYGRLNSTAEVWGCLIHEMLHCYIQCFLGWVSWASKERCVCGAPWVSHGPLFTNSAVRLANRLRLPGLKGPDIHDDEGVCHTLDGRWESVRNGGKEGEPWPRKAAHKAPKRRRNRDWFDDEWTHW